MLDFFDIFDFVTVVYKVIDNDVYFHEASDNIYKIEKIEGEEIINKRLLDVFPQSKTFGIYDKILNTYKTGKNETHELKFYDDGKFGRWRYNYLWKDGNYIKMVYHDERYLSDLKKNLMKKSNQLEMIIDNMNRAFAIHEMIFDYDGNPIDYKFIRINKPFKDMTGLSDNIIGKTVKNILPKEDANEWINIYGNIFIKNKDLHFEKYSKTFKKWYLIDAYRQNSKLFITIFEDVTNKKLQDKQKLEIINSTLSASLLIDIEGKIILLNDNACKYFNLSRDKIIGKKFYSLLPIELPEQKRKNILESLFTGKPKYFIEFYNNNYYENYIYPILNSDNSTQYIAIHIKNITKQEKLKNDLKEAKIKAEKSDLLKSLFLANMSHEIRSPMNSIIGFSEVLIDDNFDKSNQDKFLKIINANAKHLEELLNNILDYAKIEAGELDVDLIYEKFSINDLFDELEDILFDINQRKNMGLVKLIFEKRTEDDIIITDYLRLKQILYNLINNAIKFTELGHIRVGTTIQNNIITFFVEDTGVGIPNNKLKIVFDKFIQVDASSKKQHQGTGLGLSIAKSIVNILGGTIWVDSVEKQGSTFSFILPLDEKKDTKIKETKIKFDFTNINALLLEDIPENYSLLGIMLNSMKVKTHWLEDFDKNIENINNLDKINVIFIDMSITNVNIKKLLEKIKQIDKNITIIAISVSDVSNMDNIDYQIMKPLLKENISKILVNI